MVVRLHCFPAQWLNGVFKCNLGYPAVLSRLSTKKSHILMNVCGIFYDNPSVYRCAVRCVLMFLRRTDGAGFDLGPSRDQHVVAEIRLIRSVLVAVGLNLGSE